MSDTPDDFAIAARADQLRATRDQFPCDEYDEMSKSIPLCERCGHDEDAHIDQAHDEAKELLE